MLKSTTEYFKNNNPLSYEVSIDGDISKFTRFLKIIVVDDGSTDLTSTVAQRFATESQNFKIIKMKHNVGKGGAVKTGVRHSTGKFILMVRYFFIAFG
jgi:glycosyltransferase involved in cell wall biosynthesis